MNNQKSTVGLPGEDSAHVEKLATDYGFSNEAAHTLLRSLIAGGGTMAQFSHPELGGNGQWTSGGMIMIGDMFNNALKARVDGLCSDLANLLRERRAQGKGSPFAYDADDPRGNWWGTDLGSSSASGSQNDRRYAYFPAAQRLAILTDNWVTIYDSGTHKITGVSQQQSSKGSLTFSSQHGSVSLADLSIVSSHALGADTPSVEVREPAFKETDRGKPATAVSQQAAARSNLGPEPTTDIFYKIERLADMRDKGIVSEEEFLSKKTELLARL